MIELKGLWKSFENRDVLKDINATFENGKTNYYTITETSSPWARRKRKHCAGKWE